MGTNNKIHRMEFPGLLFVISGPSGVGKGTLCRNLVEAVENLDYSISVTTRPPRQGEVNGEDYIFIEKDEFLDKVAAGEFVEWAEVYGNYYGTPWKELQKALEKGRDIILEIDTQGAMQVKKHYPNGVYIFLLPPCEEELRARIEKRGTEGPEVVKKRLANLDNELKVMNEYDYAIINDSIPDALGKLKAIYTAEKCRTWRTLSQWRG
jgi:guanylate kinase